MFWLREKRSHPNQSLRSIVLTTPVELSCTRFHFAPKTSLPSVHPGWDTSLPCQVREWPVRTWSPTEQTHQEPSVTFGAKTKSQSTGTGINAYGTHPLSKEHSPCISKAVSDHYSMAHQVPLNSCLCPWFWVINTMVRTALSGGLALTS